MIQDRSDKLKTRSIRLVALCGKYKHLIKSTLFSDNAEGASHRRSHFSHNNLHGHNLHKESRYEEIEYNDPLEVFAPVEYEESQKMQFQIHGQEGPHSYRFGHDTGNGYI